MKKITCDNSTKTLTFDYKITINIDIINGVDKKIFKINNKSKLFDINVYNFIKFISKILKYV